MSDPQLPFLDVRRGAERFWGPALAKLKQLSKCWRLSGSLNPMSLAAANFVRPSPLEN
jgi:hypothetical protein